jgi:hypothetical protein
LALDGLEARGKCLGLLTAAVGGRHRRPHPASREGHEVICSGGRAGDGARAGNLRHLAHAHAHAHAHGTTQQPTTTTAAAATTTTTLDAEMRVR